MTTPMTTTRLAEIERMTMPTNGPMSPCAACGSTEPHEHFTGCAIHSEILHKAAYAIPSQATLGRWIRELEMRRYGDTTLLAAIAEFLRDPRLRAALELQEAVEWIEREDADLRRLEGNCDGPWVAGVGYGCDESTAPSLVEAVTALRAKLAEKEGGDRG